ncbi:MAG: hypothetical protein ACYC9X_07465 [Dehalococcoidia bacterium]
MTASAGPTPVDLGPQNPGLSHNYGFAADAGTLRIVVRLTPGFSDALTVQFYVRGSGISYPPGTVEHVTTQVVAGITLPATGSGPLRAQPAFAFLAAFLAAVGGAAIAAGRVLGTKAPRERARDGRQTGLGM